MPTKATKTPLPAPTLNDRVYSVDEVAELTGLAAITVRKMFRDQRIRTITLGSRRVVPAEEMRRILTEGC